MKSILFLVLVCLGSPVPLTAAESTGHCHCFQQRDYDPADSFAADNYLLTSAFNSLVAASLGRSKQKIVMMKMTRGVDPDTLLIALYLAENTGIEEDTLLSMHDTGQSWKKIMETAGLQEKKNSGPVWSGISAGISDQAIAALVTETLIKTLYRADPEQIRRLREQQFSTREINLVFALGEQTGVPVQEIIAMAGQRKTSWSEIAHRYGRSPVHIGRQILKDHQGIR